MCLYELKIELKKMKITIFQNFCNKSKNFYIFECLLLVSIDFDKSFSIYIYITDINLQIIYFKFSLQVQIKNNDY